MSNLTTMQHQRFICGKCRRRETLPLVLKKYLLISVAKVQSAYVCNEKRMPSEKLLITLDTFIIASKKLHTFFGLSGKLVIFI